MSVPMHPAAPAAKPRPSSVTISSYLLYLVAALQVIGLVLALTVIGAYQNVFESAFAGTGMEGSAGTFGVAVLIVSAVVGVIIAAGLVVLAVLNNRGNNASRIMTWVLGGIYLCCGGAGLVMQAAGGTFVMAGGNQPGAPDSTEIQRMLEEQLPGWYMPVTTILRAVTFIALLVALILLALPASNEFFRKPPAGWQPPVPGGTYPGYPQPGYPQGQSGYPPQPPSPPPPTEPPPV